jgi:hypothetical protein
MAEAAASPAGSRGVMFLPHMSAAGCPVVDARSLGAFVGLSNFVAARRYAARHHRGPGLPGAGYCEALKTAWVLARPAGRSGGRHAQCLLDAEQGRYHRSADRRARIGRSHHRSVQPSWPVLGWVYTAVSRMRLSAFINRERPTSQTRSWPPVCRVVSNLQAALSGAQAGQPPALRSVQN